MTISEHAPTEVTCTPTSKMGSSCETYAHLYVGDYFADTMDFTAEEHRTLRLLLLHLWMGNPLRDDDTYFAVVTGLFVDQWQEVKPGVLPIAIDASVRIAEKLVALRAYDGRRLPSSDWEIMRAVVLERDGYTCRYCGATRAPLEGDHVIPLSRGGTNTFANINTACAICNRKKGSRTLEEWQEGPRRPLRSL